MIDVDAILASLGEEFEDSGIDPWGGANLEDGSAYDTDGIETVRSH